MGMEVAGLSDAGSEVSLGPDRYPQGIGSGFVNCMIDETSLGAGRPVFWEAGPTNPPGSFLFVPTFAFSFLPFCLLPASYSGAREPSLEHFLRILTEGLP